MPRKWLLTLVVVALGSIALPALAQPPGQGGGGDDNGGGRGGPGGWGGGGPGGWGGGGRGGPGGGGGGFDPSGFINRMDANGNGMLDPDEISERARGFLVPQLQAAGLDPTRPIPMDRLIEAFEQMRNRGRGDDDDDNNGDGERGRGGDESTPSVPGFGEPFDLPPPPGFGIPADSPLLDMRPVEERYEQSVLDRIEGTLRRYDRNGDRVLDAEELRNGRFNRPSPQESDLDNDGRLTRVELAERYVAMISSENERRQRDGGGDENRWNRDWRNNNQNGGDDERQSNQRNRDNTNENERERTPRNRRQNVSTEQRYRDYAANLVQRYDTNKDGELQREEWAEMNGDWDDSDTDGNGILTTDEITTKFTNYANERNKTNDGDEAVDRSREGNQSGGSNGGQGRFRTTEEFLNDLGIDDSFIRDDRNADGQLQMSEFAARWTTETLAEFQARDLNGDGVITPAEWLDRGSRNRRER